MGPIRVGDTRFSTMFVTVLKCVIPNISRRFGKHVFSQSWAAFKDVAEAVQDTTTTTTTTRAVQDESYCLFFFAENGNLNCQQIVVAA